MSETILVTGPIGSGKSEVCRYLSSKGWPVYDCDFRTKALYDEVPGLKEKVEKAIGVPMSEAGIIFRDPSRREALEKVVYPEVLSDLERWKASQRSGLLFVESAVALEKPLFDGTYDRVWLVLAPDAERFRRNPRAKERSAAQAPADLARADVTIINDSTIEELHKKIDNIMDNQEKTDLSKILSVAGKHGLYRFLALSRGNAVIAESLADSRRTIFDSHSRVTSLADIAIYTSEGELKLKEVLLALREALAGAEAPSPKDDKAVKALFEKAVPNYDPDRFYTSHMRKVVEWYREIAEHASFDFAEPEEENPVNEE